MSPWRIPTHLREKINSDYLKTKVRLRWYEGGGRPAERSFLEAKLRVGARRRKVRLETAFSGTWLTHTALHDQALRRIPQELRPLGVPVPSQLRPVLRIRYTRDRFVDPLAGVRISLDADISAPAVNRELLSVPNPLPLDTAVVEVKGQARELLRTPIKEPEEIGFIMLVIAASLACATFKLAFLGIILGIGVIALFAQRFAAGALTGTPRGGLVVVSVPDREGQSASREIAELLNHRLADGRLESLSQGEDSTVVSYAFSALSHDALLALQTELREKSAGATVNIFFHRSAAI